MSCGLGAGGIVWLIASRVIECESGDSYSVATGHVEAVCGPVLDIQVGDHGVGHVVKYDEVVRPGRD